jgi:Recombination endonuclease VII
MRSCKRGHPVLPGLCKPCAKIRQENFTKRHPERHAEAVRRYKKTKYRNTAYGLPSGTVQEMEREQGGKCAICDEVKPLCVDHDHITNKVRQLLCNTCNGGIGFLKDNLELVERAADYLRRHKENK